ncbi:MAG: NAD(P)H-binding protein [Chitinophagaceae bacterium]|nr:NAD(P)H-binding protein [Chitinophagaceae bacterium]
MDIIIFGASGRTGLALVQQALSLDHTVTAFVRQKSKMGTINHKNLHVIEGDILNLEQVKAAIAGKDAVISALGVSKTLHHDPVVIDGIATIVKAMKDEGVNRCIYLSVFLACNKSGQFSFFAEKILKRIIGKEVNDHQIKEQLIHRKVDHYTIVRAARLTNKPFTGKYRHGENLELKAFLPSVSRANVAHFILQQLTPAAYINKAVLVSEN